MEFDKAKFMEKLKELVAYGKKKKSVLEYQEINDFFRDMPLVRFYLASYKKENKFLNSLKNI